MLEIAHQTDLEWNDEWIRATQLPNNGNQTYNQTHWNSNFGWPFSTFDQFTHINGTMARNVSGNCIKIHGKSIQI